MVLYNPNGLRYQVQDNRFFLRISFNIASVDHIKMCINYRNDPSIIFQITFQAHISKNKYISKSKYHHYGFNFLHRPFLSQTLSMLIRFGFACPSSETFLYFLFIFLEETHEMFEKVFENKRFIVLFCKIISFKERSCGRKSQKVMSLRVKNILICPDII